MPPIRVCPQLFLPLAHMDFEIALRALLALALAFSENELTFMLRCQGQSSCKNEDKLGRSPEKEKVGGDAHSSCCCPLLQPFKKIETVSG